MHGFERSAAIRADLIEKITSPPPATVALAFEDYASGIESLRCSEKELVQQGYLPDCTLVAWDTKERNYGFSTVNLQKEESKNLPSGTEIAKHARELGEGHPGMWANEGPHGEIRKCNLFVDRVYRDMHVPLPWDDKHIPTVKGLVKQLSNSNDWEAVYHGGMQIDKYQPQPGDCALWTKDSLLPYRENGHTVMQRYHLEHCGVLAEDGKIFYAGSGMRSGYAESDFRLMVKATDSFGPPTVIYRSRHLR